MRVCRRRRFVRGGGGICSLLVFGEKGVLKHRILPSEIKSLAVLERDVIRMATAASGGSGKVSACIVPRTLKHLFIYAAMKLSICASIYLSIALSAIL
jgi:hypothetical protein